MPAGSWILAALFITVHTGTVLFSTVPVHVQYESCKLFAVGVRSDARAWQGNGEMYSPVPRTCRILLVLYSTLAENRVSTVVLLLLYYWYYTNNRTTGNRYRTTMRSAT